MATDHLEHASGLAALAEEEARHAELAWRILEWAQRASPQTTPAALRRALTTPAQLEAPTDSAYGVLPEALGELAFEASRLRSVGQAARLLRQIDTADDAALPA